MKTSIRPVVLLVMTVWLAACNDEATLTRPGSGTSTPPPAGGNSGPPATSLVTLANLTRSADALGNIRILGTASSRASGTVSFVQVTCAFRDAAGTALGSDQSYIVGSVVKLAGTGTVTNTALNAGDTGYFEILTTRSDASVSNYSCEASFSTFAATAPAARLELTDAPAATSDFLGNAVASGSVKNTGSSPLILGQVFALTFDRADALTDISAGFISGQRAALPTGGSTGTALDVNQIGTFSVTTVTPFSDVANTRYSFNWTDVDTLAAAALDAD